jgi:anti-sigma factor RsiW
LSGVVAAAAVLLVLLLPVLIWRVMKQSEAAPAGRASSFALMAAETHLRRARGQLPLEVESERPQDISNWFSNKVMFSVKLPNYQESSGQEKLYTLEGARLVGFQNDYAAYVAYQMKSRPISLVITSNSAANPSGGEEIYSRGLKFHYNAIDGLKVITWSDRGLTYALVSDLEERGQQSCIVCHEGTKDRDFIEALKPR